MGFANWITVAISILGWFIGYISNWKINEKSKEKEMITKYLIEAYRILSNCCQRKELSPDLEKAVSDIHLFGTEKQIELVQKFINELINSHSAQYNDLLLELRNNLRNELNLPLVNGEIIHLRILQK